MRWTKSIDYICPFPIFFLPNKTRISKESNLENMKLYSEQQIKNFITEGKITYADESLELDDNYIDKKRLIASLKKLQENNKENIDSEDFSDYRKQTQKSKNKIRKG